MTTWNSTKGTYKGTLWGWRGIRVFLKCADPRPLKEVFLSPTRNGITLGGILSVTVLLGASCSSPGCPQPPPASRNCESWDTGSVVWSLGHQGLRWLRSSSQEKFGNVGSLGVLIDMWSWFLHPTNLEPLIGFDQWNMDGQEGEQGLSRGLENQPVLFGLPVLVWSTREGHTHVATASSAQVLE